MQGSSAAENRGATPEAAHVSDPLISALWRKIEHSVQPLTHEQLTPEGLRALKRSLALRFDPCGAAVLPAHGFVRGLILLLTAAAAAVTEERLGMWQAMASLAAIAAVNVRAWEELQEQEASARRQRRGHP